MAEMKFIRNRDGAQESYEELEIDNVSIAAGEVVYYASGFITNATPSSINCQSVQGVAGEAVDNTGGSSGDLEIQVLVSPNAIYEGGTNSTLAQSQIGTNVTLETTVQIDENDPKDDYTGVAHLVKFLSASKVQFRLNHYSPRA